MDYLKLSGHESFICKQYWLRRGFDFIKTNGSFRDEDAVVKLGVGKNMVSSISYWLKAFDITNDKGDINKIGNFLFGEKGNDLYIEDIASIWLLHYTLVKNAYASIYNLFFNDFRKERIEFTKDQLHQFIKQKCNEISQNFYNDNTVESDIKVLLRSYLKPSFEIKSDFEEEYAGLLNEIGLISHFKAASPDGTKNIDFYSFVCNNRIDIPPAIILYSILDNYSGQHSISFKELEVGFNSPGIVFCFTQEGLFDKLTQIANEYPQIIFSNNAGVSELQFKSTLDKWKVLTDYYGN